MTALKWTIAALVALVALPAHADVSGPVCVTDDDTLVVNGKREAADCGPSRVDLVKAKEWVDRMWGYPRLGFGLA